MHELLSSIDVFILCGGKGRRLRKVVSDVPKPLAKIGKQPFMDIVLRYLISLGLRRFILGTGYEGHLIREYYANRRFSDNVEIGFSHERIPLDTGGAVKKARHLIQSNPFFVLNGDTFSTFNPKELIRFHERRKSLLTILTARVLQKDDYGCIGIDRNSRITHFAEKGALGGRGLINAGVYLCDKRIFSRMPAKARFSLEWDFFPRLLKERMYAYHNSGFFIDIGTPERFEQAAKILGALLNP